MSPTPGRVFVVDDDPMIRRMFGRWLESDGFDCHTFGDGPSALAALAKGPPDAVCLDLQMRPMNGLETLRRIRAVDDHIPVLISTTENKVETAVDLLREGAFDYKVKPLKRSVLLNVVRNAVAQRRSESRPVERVGEWGIIGTSQVMQDVYERIRKAARADVPVLVTGESGTGKELVARAIHVNSRRSEGPFVPINCAAIPESLVESELFGHEKGAFTGADRRRIGRFEQADRGTLMLDELGEMPLSIQARLLRVLQESIVDRVGGVDPVQIDVRVISATNRDLPREVNEQRFREDLYYRLRVYRIHVPPLRERIGDLEALCDYFLEKHSDRQVSFAPAAMRLMRAHNWPGNVRELENAVQAALVECEEDEIHPGDLELSLEGVTPKPMPVGQLISGPFPVAQPPITGPVSLREQEKQSIIEALKAENGNVKRAASRLKIGRTTIYRKLDEYGLDPKQFRNS